MKLENIPEGMIDWSAVSPSIDYGETGQTTTCARQLGDVQLRLVEYSAGYVGNHWCHKGHVVYVIAGDLIIEHESGERYTVRAGGSYHVADNHESPHRVHSENGTTIFVVD